MEKLQVQSVINDLLPDYPNIVGYSIHDNVEFRLIVILVDTEVELVLPAVWLTSETELRTNIVAVANILGSSV